MVSMSLNIGVSPSQDELGLLGQQINLVTHAYTSPSGTYWCEVQGVHLTSDQIFGDSKAERRFLVYDSLPGSIHVMAIGIDANNLFVELSPYDPEAVKQTSEEENMPANVRVDKRGIWFGRRKLASVMRGSAKIQAEHGPRVLWTMSRSLSDEDRQRVIATLDGLDEAGAYEMEQKDSGRDVGAAPATSGTHRMEIRLGLQMDLIARQVPVLAIRMEGRPETRTELQQSLEFQQLLRFEAWLQRDPENAIIQALARDPSSEGQARVIKFILFKTARDVKSAAGDSGREIPWSEARKIARNILQRQHASLT
jgi:hypothetical protein